MNMTKPSEVIQRETKSPSEFYKRLCEAYRIHMPADPESAGSQMLINADFVSQAYPDIRCKFQKVKGILAMTSSQIIEITDKVFRNRDMETKGGVEKRRREDSKRADQRVAALATALPRPPRSPVNWSQLHSRPSTRRPRAALQPNQHAQCWGFSHWKKECPQNSGGKDLALAVIGLAALEVEMGSRAQTHKVPESPW